MWVDPFPHSGKIGIFPFNLRDGKKILQYENKQPDDLCNPKSRLSERQSKLIKMTWEQYRAVHTVYFSYITSISFSTATLASIPTELFLVPETHHILSLLRIFVYLVKSHH